MSFRIPIVEDVRIPKGEVWLVPPMRVTSFVWPGGQVTTRCEWDISKIVRLMNVGASDDVAEDNRQK